MSKNTNKIRTPYNYKINHINDYYTNLGFDYAGQIFKKTVSQEMYGNPLQGPLITRIESLIYYLIETTKNIKKWFSVAHDKNTTKLN